ncbi:hypothetical protein ACIQXF_16265 [Lysinibacillus sp. NPDC097231]|uniref:hypothetical protein n=1 Tax=Lysinibacillus sp. NPDC097231 TaxID=3364142 RepID=UPI0038069527
MKSNGYSPSTTLAQGELLAFHITQKSTKIHDKNSDVIQSVGKHRKFLPYKYLCIRILPFDVIDEALDISFKKQKVNEIDFYHSGQEIARWLIKKSEYNKPVLR